MAENPAVRKSIVASADTKTCDLLVLDRAEILHMHICPQSDVIRQIPAYIVGIRIENDVVAIPKPIRAIVEIGRSHAEVEIIETESGLVAPPPRRYTWLAPISPVKCPCSQGWSR